jgi:hypothetical protein
MYFFEKDTLTQSANGTSTGSRLKIYKMGGFFGKLPNPEPDGLDAVALLEGGGMFCIERGASTQPAASTVTTNSSNTNIVNKDTSTQPAASTVTTNSSNTNVVNKDASVQPAGNGGKDGGDL